MSAPKRHNEELRHRIANVSTEIGLGEALIPDGFDDAIIGIGTRFMHPVAILDYDKCLKLLAKEFLQDAATSGRRLDEDEALLEAEEWMDHNVTGAYVGESTPIYVRFLVSDIDKMEKALGLAKEDIDD